MIRKRTIWCLSSGRLRSRSFVHFVL